MIAVSTGSETRIRLVSPMLETSMAKRARITTSVR